MITRLLVVYGLLIAAFALGLIVAVIRDRHELRHHEDHCTGVWLPWPSLARTWLVRCDRCYRFHLATRRVRELRTKDLELAQTFRWLELEGAELLRGERERAS